MTEKLDLSRRCDFSKPSTSIVIPTRNRLSLLKEAIDSVHRQTSRDWEMIIVDDASDDGTWSWLSSLNDPRIRGIRLDRHGERSAARNRGLKESHGTFILFLDDDDRLLPAALERLTRVLMLETDAIAAVGARVYFNGAGYRRRVPHPRIRLMRKVWAEALSGTWIGLQGQTLYRTAALQSVGAWNENLFFAEDHELWLRLSQVGPVVVIPELVLECRVHKGSGKWPLNSTKLEQEIIDLHLTTLASDIRTVGSRLVGARQYWLEGQAAYGKGAYWEAMRHFARAIHSAPELLRSPLSAPPLILACLKALFACTVGNTIFDNMRKIRRLVRRLLKHDPWYHGPTGTQSHLQ